MDIDVSKSSGLLGWDIRAFPALHLLKPVQQWCMDNLGYVPKLYTRLGVHPFLEFQNDDHVLFVLAYMANLSYH